MNPGESLREGHLLDGRYRVKKPLGSGGMGRVYLSNDTRLANRPVAVKEMFVGDGVKEKKAVEDFAREARVLALLSHPGIPSLIDYFFENGRHYLVMEFVAGGDLQGLLDKLGAGARLPEPTVLRWARQMLDVLDFLHGQNPAIIYRDLKPGNIMIDKGGRAMLLDFGIARFLPPGGRGTQIGSVGYAPPEQYMGKVEARSDLFSLAATMHQLLSGRDPQLEPPFSFPPLRELAPEVSAMTAEAVMRALDKDIERRPATARSMLALLPEPGPETADQSALGSGLERTIQSVVTTMPTVVLAKPGAVAPSPARPPASRSSSRPATPRRSPAANTPTVVLSDVAPKGDASSSVGKAAGDRARRISYSLAERARALLERGIKSAVASVTPVVESAASSRAKTQELSPWPLAATPAAQSDSTTHSGGSTDAARRSWSAATPALFDTAPKKPAATAGPTARLLVRGENSEFAISGIRAVVGRSVDSSDALDIDLAVLGAMADRVSRRHAEIVRRGQDFFIRDLGSLNGTYVAGRGRLGRDQMY
ncbi:MAG: protein kinase domain-containing protein, partial [Candidatus Binataceae bacterium]